MRTPQGQGILVATWNLNNRVGKVRFRPEASQAIIASNADIIALTEFFPQKHEALFRKTLEEAGWGHQMLSREAGEKANRILILSRLPLLPLNIDLPDFDRQFPSNLLGITLPTVGLNVVAVRVPAYARTTAPLLPKAWDWLESIAASLKEQPGIIMGDLNVSLKTSPSRGGIHLRRIMDDGWQRAEPAEGSTFFGHNGRNSEIDHILATKHCTLTDSVVIRQIAGYPLAGLPGALSDHAMLQCRIEISSSTP